MRLCRCHPDTEYETQCDTLAKQVESHFAAILDLCPRHDSLTKPIGTVLYSLRRLLPAERDDKLTKKAPGIKRRSAVQRPYAQSK